MNTYILSSWDDVKEFEVYAKGNTFPIISLDTETDSVIEKKAKLYGVGIAFEDHEAFYIPIRKPDQLSWWTPKQESEIAALVLSLAKEKKLIGHNIIYDILVIQNNWGYDLTPYIYSDTILQKHTVDEERPFGLKETAVKYLGDWADKAQKALYENIEKNGGKTLKSNIEMYKADTEVLGEYCCWDVLLTRKLFDIFEARIHEEGLYDLFYKEEIMPLYKEVTIPMKQRGFPVDVPYFEKVLKDIHKDIDILEDEILFAIKEKVDEFTTNLLNEDYPIKKTGTFPKLLAKYMNVTLPITKDGNITLSKKALIQQAALSSNKEYFNWILDHAPLNQEILNTVQMLWYKQDNPDKRHVFNLKSNDHLKKLFFKILRYKPLSKTEKGEPQIDDDMIESIKGDHVWIQKLLDFKKLIKLKSTYIEGILERQIDGVIYASFLQFGTTSGRYSSTDPNLQNLPRVKEDDSGLSELVLKYVNSIKKGFIAGPGYKIVNSDYSQLEPRAFAEACGDPLLQAVFVNKEDLYGSIAKNIWDLECSANEVKKKHPEFRQKAKIIALAVVYGAEAGRISQLMKISYEEADKIIEDYLEAYPGLRSYMESCNKNVCSNGGIKTKFGRTRHLPEAQKLYKSFGLRLLDKRWAKQNGLDEVRWKFKNMLNLSKNFPIQGVAAHIVNRAAIAINKEFKVRGINGILVAQVHDELTSIVEESRAEEAKAIIKDKMENTTIISVPLSADPLIAYSWDEAK